MGNLSERRGRSVGSATARRRRLTITLKPRDSDEKGRNNREFSKKPSYLPLRKHKIAVGVTGPGGDDEEEELRLLKEEMGSTP